VIDWERGVFGLGYFLFDIGWWQRLVRLMMLALYRMVRWYAGWVMDVQGDSVIHNTQHVKKALSFPGAGAQSGRDVRVPLQA
jgi:hypothetical protein